MWMFVYVVSLEAQSYESLPFSRLNSNASFTVSVRLSKMASYTRPAWGFVYGAGYKHKQTSLRSRRGYVESTPSYKRSAHADSGSIANQRHQWSRKPHRADR